MKLSILIPTTPDRKHFMDKLILELQRQNQAGGFSVEILVNEDNYTKTIGEKRNELLADSKGEYIAFIDSDDRVNSEYIYLVMGGIIRGVDACSLRGIITFDGTGPEIFEHSLRYPKYVTNDKPNIRGVKYERFTNHLNTIKSEIAKKFIFPKLNRSEDSEWATQLHNSGLIKTEHEIQEVLYHYDYINNK